MKAFLMLMIIFIVIVGMSAIFLSLQQKAVKQIILSPKDNKTTDKNPLCSTEDECKTLCVRNSTALPCKNITEYLKNNYK